jgi:hypothetical protein
MAKKLFGELVESMKRMNKIVRGKRAPSRQLSIPHRPSSCAQDSASASRSLQLFYTWMWARSGTGSRVVANP